MNLIKTILFSLMMFFGMAAQAGSLDACSAQFVYGPPSITKANTTDLCHTAYALKHDNVAKIPVWVAYTLTPEHAEGCFPRTNKFAADPLLKPGDRAELNDYRNSGYDKGHVANDADMSWSATTERESFLLSNMNPQVHGLNAGIWKDLESDVRDWAFLTKHTLQVYAGPIYDPAKDKTIGADKVVVPHAFYKIVIDTQTKQTLAFIFPHEPTSTGKLVDYQVTVSAVEKATGVTFNVPNDKNKITTIWKVDLKAFQVDKQRSCH